MINDDWLMIIDYPIMSFICGENKNIPYEIVYVWNKIVTFVPE